KLFIVPFSTLQLINFIIQILKRCAMNFKLSLFAIAAVTLASCSSSYKTGQTPDDVYYSPVREADSRVDQDRYREREEYTRYDDRQLRMSAYDRRWRTMNNSYY